MSRCLVSLAAVSLCGIVAGCGLAADDDSTPRTDAGVSHSDGLVTSKTAKPVVDRPPASVCTASVPIQGSAGPGTTVFAVGGLETSGVATDPNPVTGRFCLDVRLMPDADNSIEVKALDPVLGLSDPVVVTVRQQTSCGSTDPEPPVDDVKPQNVALGLVARSSKAPGEGNETLLTDGDANTVVTYAAGWASTDADIWLTLKLPKLTELSKIVVKWRDSSGNGAQYGANYKVLISQVPEPGDPDLNNGYWDVKSIDGGTGGIDTIDLTTTKPSAYHVALWLNEDGDSWTWSETFALAELEVWDSPPKSSTPPAQPNTCQSSSN